MCERYLMDTNRTKTRGDASVWIAFVLLLASVAVNFVQSHRISTLRSRLEALESQHELQIGSKMPDIVGLNDGKTQTLHFHETSLPTVIYVFTPQCGWCKKNLPNLHALIDGSTGRYQLVGISLSRRVAHPSPRRFLRPVSEPWVPRPCVFCKGGYDAACTLAFVPSGLHRTYGAHHLHFITCSCYRRLPLLGAARSCDRFLVILEHARQRYRFVVVGYVVMPEHIHLLVTEPEVGTPSTVMQVLKQRTARALLPKKKRTDPRQRRVAHPFDFL